MDLNRDDLAIVVDGDVACGNVNLHIEGVHGGVALLVVVSVEEDLVKNLVEPWYVGDHVVHHGATLIDLELLRVLLHEVDVAVQQLKNGSGHGEGRSGSIDNSWQERMMAASAQHGRGQPEWIWLWLRWI